MRSIEIRRVKRLAELSIIATFALAPAFATTINYTGAEQTFTVTTTGEYQIVAYGAQGGAAGLNYYGATPGLGAEIGGNFELTAGEVLDIYVGGAGSSSYEGGSGGGGTFVVLSGSSTPLLVAGGGGGVGYSGDNGGPGLTTESGGEGHGDAPGLGGTNGSGGGGDNIGNNDGGAGGGGGFVSSGVDGHSDGYVGLGGQGFPEGLAGGSYIDGGALGGYGGGGGTGGASGGGGGGYSGGGAGGVDAGGGGGSYDAGTNQILIAGENSGNGEVLISAVSPEPASFGLLGAALAGLGLLARKRITGRSK